MNIFIVNFTVNYFCHHTGRAIRQARHMRTCIVNFTLKYLSMPSYRQAIKQAGHMTICNVKFMVKYFCHHTGRPSNRLDT
jgi:hypothetical protein